MRVRRWLIVSAVALLGGFGCGQTPGVGAASPTRLDSVLIAVDNLNFYDAVVYAQYQGHTPLRLGFVTGFTKDTFSLRWHSADLRMRMHFVGAGQTVSNPLIVNPGDLLELTIQPNAHRRR